MPTGDFFPQQFALGILGLKQKKQEFEANLAQQRSDAAARNFQENQRLTLARDQMDLGRQQQETDNAFKAQAASMQAQHQMFSEQQAVAGEAAAQQHQQSVDWLNSGRLSLDQQKEVNNYKVDMAKVQEQTAFHTGELQQKSASTAADIKAKDDASFALGVNNLNSKGGAFFPLSKAADLSGFLDSAASNPDGPQYHTIDIPGVGTYLQSMSPEEKAKITAHESTTKKNNAETLLIGARQEAIASNSELQQKRVAIMAGRLNIEDTQQLGVARNQYTALFNKTNEAFTKQLFEARSSGNTKEVDRLTTEFNAFKSNPENILDEGSKKHYRMIDGLLQAQLAKHGIQGEPTPVYSDPEAIKAADGGPILHEPPKLGVKPGIPQAGPSAPPPPVQAINPTGKPKATPDVKNRYKSLSDEYRSLLGNPSAQAKARKRAIEQEINQLNADYSNED